MIVSRKGSKSTSYAAVQSKQKKAMAGTITPVRYSLLPGVLSAHSILITLVDIVLRVLDHHPVDISHKCPTL